MYKLITLIEAAAPLVWICNLGKPLAYRNACHGNGGSLSKPPVCRMCISNTVER